MLNKTASQAWIYLLQNLKNHGRVYSPRGMATKEMLGTQSIVSMSYPVVSVLSRKINYQFMMAEAWWILTGGNQVKQMAPYLKNLAQFSDDGRFFNGAYGPKVIDQLWYVIETLKTDVLSRQAVLTIWRENPRPSKDIPCTVAMQWLIRDNTLFCKTDMRSSDAWIGWIYDVFNFSTISAYIALSLKDIYPELRLGNLILTPGSQHIYDYNWNDCEALIQKCIEGDVGEPSPHLDLSVYTCADELIYDLKDGADNLLSECSSFIKKIGGLSGQSK